MQSTQLIEKIKNNSIIVAIVGLGYVGLPLAVGFAKKGITVIGYDVNEKRIDELKNGHDRTLEIEDNNLKNIKNIVYTKEENELKKADVYIITVPTPVDAHKVPDLHFIKSASEAIGRNFGNNRIVILESTVYPGVTEELVVSTIEKLSGLKYLKDFKAGYSPERINPGDKEHNLESVVKVVSGSDEETLDAIDELYKKVAKKTFRAKNIRVAEAAKVIENTQRDINIALVNELSMLFEKIGLDTWDVLETARTKWNFLDFKPGLVGGHCIPEDPYYLVHLAVREGFHPQIITAGRRINDSVPEYILNKLIKKSNEIDAKINGMKILVLGLTFKENVPDVRSSLTIRILKSLVERGAIVSTHDPMLSNEDIKKIIDNKISIIDRIDSSTNGFDCVILNVFHNAFKKLAENGIIDLCKNNKGKKPIIFDVRHMLNKNKIESLGAVYVSM